MPNRLPAGPVRTATIQAAWLVLQQALTTELRESVCEEIATADYVVRVEVVPRQEQQQATGTAAGQRQQEMPVGSRLTGLDRAVLRVLTDEWRSATWIAHQLDREPDSYLRNRLRHLERAGHLEHDHRGYRRGDLGDT